MDPIAPSFEDLEEIIKKNYKNPNLKLIQEAFAMANHAHAGKFRESGHPFITHPLATACKLAEMKLGLNVVAAGLLHDVVEDTEISSDDITEKFGEEITFLVESVTKLKQVKYQGVDRYIENLRRMFMAMAMDVRVVFIKFADRLHNLRTLYARPEAKQLRIGREVIEIYGPIASRLGMGEMKGDLEDSAFAYAYPEDFQKTIELYEKYVTPKKPYVKEVIALTQNTLEEAGIPTLSVHGRAKRLYSLYKKLERYDNDITKIHDLVAIRVVVTDVADCYTILGILHNQWTPLPGRIKDYISQPKPNGYRSLHTTVFCKGGQIVEFQIRTQEMHELAEYGIAAHWRYKETGSNKIKNIRWMEELSIINKEISDKKNYLEKLESLKIDVFRDRIFVFTPKGDVIDLPENATPIDFAYFIHTDIGNKATTCKINDKMANLNTELKSGDICEIIIDKNRKAPNADWLKFVKTNNARSKIKNATKNSVKGWLRGVVNKS